MPLIRIGINGFGPVGRHVFKLLRDCYPELQVAAIGIAGPLRVEAQAPLQPHASILDRSSQMSERPASPARDILDLVRQNIPILPRLEPHCVREWAAHNVVIVIDTSGSRGQHLNLGLIKLGNKASLLYHDSNPIVSANGQSTPSISFLTLQRVVTSALIWAC